MRLAEEHVNLRTGARRVTAGDITPESQVAS